MKLSELIEKYGDCEVSDDLLEMVKPKGEWTPSMNERYYFITGVGTISNAKVKGSEQDGFRVRRRNCYKTEEEAKFALDMYNFCEERSFKPDWGDCKQKKFTLILECKLRKADFGISYERDFSPFYYPTEEAVKEVIDKYSFEELAKYYGRV